MSLLSQNDKYIPPDSACIETSALLAELVALIVFISVTAML